MRVGEPAPKPLPISQQSMRVRQPAPIPEAIPERHSYLWLYERALALPDGQSLPVEFRTAKEAKRFWINACSTGRPGWKRGVRGSRRKNVVYLFKAQEGGEP